MRCFVCEIYSPAELALHAGRPELTRTRPTGKMFEQTVQLVHVLSDEVACHSRMDRSGSLHAAVSLNEIVPVSWSGLILWIHNVPLKGQRAAVSRAAAPLSQR